mgnify:FL=1
MRGQILQQQLTIANVEFFIDVILTHTNYLVKPLTAKDFLIYRRILRILFFAKFWYGF